MKLTHILDRLRPALRALRGAASGLDERDWVVIAGAALLALGGWMAFPPLGPTALGGVLLYIGLRSR